MTKEERMHLTSLFSHKVLHGCRVGCLPFLLTLIATVTASPLWAQVDLAGEWSENVHEDYPERVDVTIGDYVGMPINEATRMRGDTWDAEQWSMVEHECHQAPVDFAPRIPIGPNPPQMRIWSDVDPLTQGAVAWHALNYSSERTIYMDGRSHPPEWAADTWQGFSTGEWVGDMLKVTTTHLKEGYLRRNGLARSEKATVTEYFIRYQNTLTLVTVVEDPVYLTEPVVLTSGWILDTDHQVSPNFCISSMEVDHPKGWVAYHLPGENPWLEEYSKRTGVPYEATRGGAETMYPEYQERLATMPMPPKLKSDSSEKGR